jgi:hypothetical protein
MSFAFCAAGIGEAVITCTHTSFAAAFAPARLPASALLQIPSTLLFTLAASAGSRVMINLQIDAYSFTAAASSGLNDSAGVAVVAGLLGAAVEVLAGTTVAVVAGVLVTFEVLVEPPPPPQAASSPEHKSATTSGAAGLPVICFPLGL